MNKRKIFWILILLMFAAILSSCEQSERVSYNISKQANNLTRKITVVNIRDNTILYELIGKCSLENEGHNELSVISEVSPGEYKKDFIYLSEWTTYIVQDVSGSYVDQYHYEVNILPQMIGGITITSNN